MTHLNWEHLTHFQRRELTIALLKRGKTLQQRVRFLAIGLTVSWLIAAALFVRGAF